MKQKNIKRLKQLEYKWLTGTITPEEAALYSRWYKWQQGAPFRVPVNMAQSMEEHKSQNFNRLLSKINVSKEDISTQIQFYQSRNRQKLYRRIAVAAGILGITCTIWLYNYTHSNQKVIAQYDAQPGQKGLMLTLNNGHQILLDSVNDGIIAEENGVKIYKKNGELTYVGDSKTPIYNKATTIAGRQYQIKLTDGSAVWLNASSELVYPVKFNQKERLVSVKGEAFFSIKHQQNNAPFIVNVDNKKIQVLGTQFNVTSYTNEPNTTVTLLQGSINLLAGTSTKHLNPNQAASSPHKSTTIDIKNVDASKSILWMKQEFNFDDISLEDIMKRIERWYNVTVIYKDNIDKNMRFMGTTPMNQNLSQVIQMLELSGDIHLKLDGKQLIVSK